MVVLKNALPRMGLGMAALGRPGYINLDRGSVFDTDTTNSSDVKRRSEEKMQNQANIVMEAMMKESKIRNMIPWFDCARSYGLSEKFVGEFLRNNNVKPNEVYVSSKWGYTYVADFRVELEDGKAHEVKDHSLDNFLKQVEETKTFLGEYLDLYQVHSATFESGILTDIRVHEAMSQCRKDYGWKIGLSVSSPAQGAVLREAMKIKTAEGIRLFDSVQCTFNILEQSPFDALLEAHNAGMDIIIKEGMANGRILKNQHILDISKQTHYPPDALGLATILCQSFQPRVLSGAVTPEQLISNLNALELSEKIKNDNKDLLKELMSYKIESESYWQERAALVWN
jgi:aryl-alcohol dehydrogenase-like predicted oxidoreductase